MADNIGLGVSTPGTYPEGSSTVQGGVQAPASSKAGTAQYQSDIVSLAGTVIAEPYVDAAQNPGLPQPGPDGNNTTFMDGQFQVDLDPNTSALSSIADAIQNGFLDPSAEGNNATGSLQNLYESSIQKELDKITDPVDKAMVEYAHYNSDPETLALLNPNQKELLKNVEKKAADNVNQKGGDAAAGFKGKVDNTAYNTKLAIKYEDAYTAKLTQMKDNGEITDEEFKQLEQLLRDPTLKYPNQAQLNKLQTQITQDVRSSFIAEVGIPSNFQPQVDTTFQTISNNGAWRTTFAENLDSYQPALNADMKAQVQVALADPSAATGEVKTILDGLMAKTTAQVQEAKGLPPTWKPTETYIDPSTLTTQQLFAQKSVENLQDLLHTAQKTIEGLDPSIKGDVNYSNYLKAIGLALNALQEMLYIIQSRDTGNAKIISQIRFEAQKNKLDAHAKELKEMQEKQKAGKGGFLGFLGDVMKIFGPIMMAIVVIAAILLTPFLGPMAWIAVAVATAMLVASCVVAAGGPDLMQKGFELMDQMVQKILGDSAPKWLKDISQAIVKLVAVIAVVAGMCFTGPVGIFLALQLGMEGLTKSNIIGDTVEACGGDGQAKMIATIVTMVALTVTIAIVTTIATLGVGIIAAIPAGTPITTAVVFQVIINALRSALSSAMAMAQSAATAVGEAGQTAMHLARQALASSIAMARDLARTIAMNPQLLKEIPAEMLHNLQTSITNAAKIAAEGAGNVLKGAKDLAGSPREMIRSMNDITQDLLAQTEAITKSVARGVDARIDKIVDAVKTTKDTLKQALQSQEDFVNLLSSIKDKGFDKLDDISNSLRNMGDETLFTRLNQAASVGTFASDVGQKAPEIARDISQYELLKRQAELALSIGNLKAYEELMEVMIKILTKIINQLIDGLTPEADMVKSIGDLKKKIVADATVDFTGMQSA